MPPTRYRRDTYGVLANAKRQAPLRGPSSKPWQNLTASREIWTRLDRVAVLGEDDSAQSHSGCVNALHWSPDGSVLVSAGDDTRIHLWRLDPSETPGDYPLTCTAQIHTGHTNNIFNAHILPASSRIATCAADRQVRVFDVNRGGLSDHAGKLTVYQEEQTCIRILKCHSGRVKRIITENSPDYFLTVAEDGSVRQHDLRTPHKCSKRDDMCPPPLLKLPVELSTIALSPLTPWNFVVAGESPFAYLFDRRQTGRHLKEEWGVQCDSEDLTSCVRRFGRRKRNKNEYAGHEHITGSRMSQENGHELILSYSADSSYLYSIRDTPEEYPISEPSLLPSNKRRRLDSPSSGSESSGNSTASAFYIDGLVDAGGADSRETTDDSPSENETVDDAENDGSQTWDDGPQSLRLPVVYPRRQYRGACNVATVKDVNFAGPRDEYVVSGSDDGNFFMWDKVTGELLDIHEGDGSVVNVIEQHPSLPVLAVSGIDDTVKIFAPTSGSKRSSRMSRSDEIVHNNTLRTGQPNVQRIRLSDIFLQYREALRGAGAIPEDAECVHQ